MRFLIPTSLALALAGYVEPTALDREPEPEPQPEPPPPPLAGE